MKDILVTVDGFYLSNPPIIHSIMLPPHETLHRH